MIILVTGTPGTGKTTIAKALAKSIKHKYLDVNKVIEKYNLREGYDKERKTYIIDENKLKKILTAIIKENKNLIIDSHLSHYVRKSHVNYCIVTKTALKTLKQRLQKRKYHEEKITENLQAEIFDICLMEAVDLKHNIIVIDTTKDKTENLIKIIKNEIKRPKNDNNS